MRFFTTGETRSMLTPSMQDLKYAAADFLASSDFISRTIGMNNSYEDIMLFVQALGREPVSLLGKDYPFIFDHVRRNYQQGVTVPNMMHNDCPRFTFYKEKPTVRFADPYQDALNLLARWMPKINLPTTKDSDTNLFYAESSDGYDENRSVNVTSADTGTASGRKVRSFENLASCDLIKKTNDNFTRGLYNTLVARFHTNTQESKDPDNPTQTAISATYGMSHGRNLLKLKPDDPNGYDNPYCRVWTYHHQYHRMLDAIRPFEDANTAEKLESMEETDNGVGFRTLDSEKYGVEGGSKRLDRHGVLNYDNGFVNIAPTAKISDYFYDKVDSKSQHNKLSIKKCMFSIENLAWRDPKKQGQKDFDAYGLSAEQRGPLGGRIMWFPPYDINFNEDVSVKWNSNEFIGRGENIYTYTNTERRGNLSFTLLIDHPSILDYWSGHARNGMKNQGDRLDPGNSGGVDNKRNQENTLLRFFAGCDILSASVQKYKKGGEKSQDKEIKNPKDNPGETTEASRPSSGAVCCVLYFPNNYSGADDRGKDDFSPVHYLMNGIGTQKSIGVDNKLIDIPINMNSLPMVGIEGFSTAYGGYELIRPISVAGTGAVLTTESARQSSYYNTSDEEGKFEYDEELQLITDSSGKRVYQVRYGDTGNGFELAKIVCTTPPPKTNKDKKYYKRGEAQDSNKYWNFMRWYYRVDNAYANHCLDNPESYIDDDCCGLNGSGYGKIKSHDLYKSLALPDDTVLVPFAALFNELEKDTIIGKDKAAYGITDVIADEVRKLTSENSGVKITEVRFNGHASIAGYDPSNVTLSKERKRTLSDWFKKYFPAGRIENDKIYTDGKCNKEGKSKANYGHVNDEGQKIWRSASVTIFWERSKTESASNQESKVVPGKIGQRDVMLNQTDVVSKKTGFLASNGGASTAYEWLNNSAEGQKFKENGYYITYETFKGPNGKETIMPLKHPISDVTTSLEDIRRTIDYDKQHGGENKDIDLENGLIKVTDERVPVERYDNEGEFFELLSKSDPFLHHLITDKIKYFDPAYHSVSPEGFNARLTFLHQCTRQGATIGNSDMNVKTAYNLAFGRPPVCVLRVGDFYYTKIIINSMQLNYDSPQWDLNPEGIGVMPMFAKVSINFTFIGGSDLAGPIARLQNAVSFNYYANTGVYDNRAEAVEYDEDGSGKETKYKPFNYPNSSE